MKTRERYEEGTEAGVIPKSNSRMSTEYHRIPSATYATDGKTALRVLVRNPELYSDLLLGTTYTEKEEL